VRQRAHEISPDRLLHFIQRGGAKGGGRPFAGLGERLRAAAASVLHALRPVPLVR